MLDNSGNISYKQAIEKAESEYEKYRAIQDQKYISTMDEFYNKYLEESKEKNMTEAILGCYENNYGSNKTILKNGGILYKNDCEERKLSNDWSIKLNCNYYKIKL